MSYLIGCIENGTKGARAFSVTGPNSVQGMDADEAVTREDGEHSPLCVSVVEPDERDRSGHRYHCTGSVVEDQIPDPEGLDFLDRIDLNNEDDGYRGSYHHCELVDDEFVVCGCTEELVFRLQEMKMVVTCIVSLGKGLYKVFFPISCRDDLVAAI